MHFFFWRRSWEGEVSTGLPRGRASCRGWDRQWILAVGWNSFSSSCFQRVASYSVMFLGHIALLCLLFSSCTAVPNELFLFLFFCRCCVCVCVPAVLSRFPTVNLHMNNTAALTLLLITLLYERWLE